MATVMKMANGICKNAPIAVAQAKKAINEGLQLDIDAAIAVEVKDFSDASLQKIRLMEWNAS